MFAKLRLFAYTALTLAAAASLVVAAAVPTAPANAADPIKIGLGMSLMGKLAGNGKMALLGMQIWQDDVNAAGGLLGRPVKLVYYDDQSNPAQVPGSIRSCSMSTRST